MQRENIVVPECYVDTNLMNVLLNKSCNHQKGCATVCKTLDVKLSDQFAIAVIDKDKKEPKALEQFEQIGESEHIIVCKHQTKPHYLIQIKPAIEEFILDAAKELNVNLADYGLPTELNELRKITKTTTAKEDVKFARLFHALRSASHIQCLDNMLQYLLVNKYTASDADILKIMQIPS